MRPLALALALALAAPAARADEADALFRQGQEAERRLDFAAAVDAYDRALALRPSAAFALRARIRRDDLRAHGEGGFAPLERLERVRRSTVLASDPAALGELMAAARGFPPGRVQAEALLLVAEAFAHRLGDPRRAIEPATLLADGPFDRSLRARGLTLLVDAHEALGQGPAARAAVAARPGLAPETEARWRTADRRRRLARGSAATLAGAAAALLASLVKGRAWLRSGWRAWLRAPTSLAVCGAVALGGAGLARRFDGSLSVRPFLLLGAGVWVVDRAAFAWRRALGPSRPARLAAAALGVASVGAVAVLALLLSDPAYLESFGL